MRRSLVEGTAQLPEVELTPPTGRIGRSTHDAIRSGVMFGLLDKVVGMVHNLSREFDHPMEVVLTGGWGEWISEQSGFRYEENLVLKGVSDLMRLSEG